jgi:hypothetical protein
MAKPSKTITIHVDGNHGLDQVKMHTLVVWIISASLISYRLLPTAHLW